MSLLKFKVIADKKYLLHGTYPCERQAINQACYMEGKHWKVIRQGCSVYIRDCQPVKRN